MNARATRRPGGRAGSRPRGRSTGGHNNGPGKLGCDMVAVAFAALAMSLGLALAMTGCA